MIDGKNVQGYDNNPKDIVVLYEDLEVRTLDDNKYKENHCKDVVKKRQGNMIGKIYRKRERVLYLKTRPLEL